MTRSGVAEWASFPRPCGNFVGRHAELSQLVELLSREPVFLIYGVAGIGKSELVYELVDRVRAAEPWCAAHPILVEVQPHHRVDRVITILDELLSGSSARGSDHRVAGNELARVGRVLDRTPHLLFLDDVHHLDPGELAQVLGYLARHVRCGRILVASRREISLSATAPPPVVVRLGTLDERETGELVGALARKLAIEAPPPALVYQRSHGSPFFVQRQLVHLAGTTCAPEDSLEASLRSLATPSFELLLTIAVMRARIEVSRLGDGGDHSGLLREIECQFLVTTEAGTVVVHDLVRDALLRMASRDEIAAAHRRAADLYLARFLGDPGRCPLALIEAVHSQTAASEAETAWRLVEEWYPRISAAGLDHLLREDLQALWKMLPGCRVAIQLFIARILLRRSLVDEAQEVLRRVAMDPAAVRTYRYLLLGGEVAQRSGRLAAAANLFQTAREVAATEVDRFHSGLQLAGVASLRGDGIEARRVLDDALAGLPLPSARHRGRFALHVALSYAMEERHRRTADVAARAAVELDGQGLDDIEARLAMFEILSRIELDELGPARRLVSAALAQGNAHHTQLEPLCSGALMLAEGRPRAAVTILEPVLARFESHRERTYACAAGLLLADGYRMLGMIMPADVVAIRVAELARTGGLTSIDARAALGRARLLLAVGDFAGVHARVNHALTCAHVTTTGIIDARLCLAWIHAVTGDSDAWCAELERAQEVAGDDHQALSWRIALERAETAGLLGDAETAVTVGEQARLYYQEVGRSFAEARAGMAVAGGHLVHGELAGQLLAERILERSRQLALAGEYRLLLLRGAVLAAALLAQRGRAVQGREVLADALTELGDENTAESQLVRAILQPGSRAVPIGINLMLDGLAPRRASHFRMVGSPGTRRATDHDVEQAAASCDLVIDLVRGMITARRGEVTIKGKPITTRLLAALVERQPEAVSAETLYREVWNGSEYHPLRHRNTVYVALNRLRRTLREVFPEREMVDKAPGGWRMADDVEACVIRTGSPPAG